MNRIVLAGLLLIMVPCAAVAAKDYSGKDLQSKDFTNDNLNGASFDKADLQFANFTNATLKNATFRGANLQHANFRKAVLDGADFTGADLKSAHFTDAKVWNAKLQGAEIHLARAEILAVKGSKLNFDFKAEELLSASQEATSGSLSFHNSDMRNSLILGEAKGVDFRGADLRGANLSQASNVESALLKGAKYDEQTRWKIDPAVAGADLVQVRQSKHPLVGKWLILKEKGATESGGLRINPDLTFEWDYSQNQPVIKGKWEEAGEQVLLKQGEKGQNWKARRAGKDEIHLTGDKGDERIAVGDANK